jgi:hypothetical protein
VSEITSLSIQGLQGGGGRLPQNLGLLTSLRHLDASGCALARYMATHSEKSSILYLYILNMTGL